MKTIYLDGLPGITIEGKKGNLGRKGNKTIIYSAMNDFNADASVVCNIIRTPWALNDYNYLVSDSVSNEDKISFLKDYTAFISDVDSEKNIVMKLSYDDSPDIFQYDYFIYPDESQTALYLIVNESVISSLIKEAEGAAEETPDSDTGQTQTTVNFLLFKVDEWKSANAVFNKESKQFQIEISSTSKEYPSWDGRYFIDSSVPCLPRGTAYISKSEYESASTPTGPGHLFLFYVDASYERNKFIGNNISALRNNLLNSVTTVYPSIIHGTIYDIETNAPVKNVKCAIYTYSAAEAEDRTVEDNKYKYNTIYNLYNNKPSLFQTTNEDGEFTFDLSDLQISANDYKYFPLAVITEYDYDDNDRIKGTYIANQIKLLIHADGTLYNEDDFLDMQVYLYRSQDSAKIYKPGEPFNIVDTYKCYNTSKIEVPEEPASIEFVNISYKSSLDDIENRKIKIEAEFTPSEVQSATPSTCYTSQWMSEKDINDLDRNTAHVNGRIENFTNEFNFDNENLRSFTIIVKDYDQVDNPKVSIPSSVYNSYNIYMYMYYKTSGSSSKKILLTEDYINVK